MDTNKWIIFPNRAAFNGKIEAVLNWYEANNTNTGEVESYDKGIDSATTDEVAMQVIGIDGFPWSPEKIVALDRNDSKWFGQSEII